MIVWHMDNKQILTQADKVGDPVLQPAPFTHVLHLCCSLWAKPVSSE